MTKMEEYPPFFYRFYKPWSIGLFSSGVDIMLFYFFAETADLTGFFGGCEAPPMVYISGEDGGVVGLQCSAVTGKRSGDVTVHQELIMDKWVKPSVDISKWEFYDLSCKDH